MYKPPFKSELANDIVMFFLVLFVYTYFITCPGKFTLTDKVVVTRELLYQERRFLRYRLWFRWFLFTIFYTIFVFNIFPYLLPPSSHLPHPSYPSTSLSISNHLEGMGMYPTFSLLPEIPLSLQ
jgi:hypothetical protein